MFAARLHGVEILHPDVKGNMTVLWCKNTVKRDVSVLDALSAVLDDIAAGGARRNQQPLPVQIDVFELATQHSGNLVHQLQNLHNVILNTSYISFHSAFAA